MKRAHLLALCFGLLSLGVGCVSGAPKPMLDAKSTAPPEPSRSVKDQESALSAASRAKPPIAAKRRGRKRAPRVGSSPEALKSQYARDPRVSFSRGEEGGFLVLWPRVIPSATNAELDALLPPIQAQATAITTRSAAGRPVDVRPEPQRVCPVSGCKAASVGVLLVHKKGGCAAIALVSPPGQSNAQLVPWAGKVLLKSEYIAFREPPESYVTVRDFVPCAGLLEEMSKRTDVVEGAVNRLR